MPRSVYEDDDDDDLDADGLLRDGRRYRVPLQMMDSDGPPQRGPFRPVQPLDSLRGPYRGGHAALCGTSITDALGDGGLSLNRPGYRLVAIDDAAVQARDEAWQERGRINREAWRTPPERPSRSTGTRQDAHSDLGRPQTAARPSNASRASPGVFDQQARADADLAWEERGRRMADAWRG